MLTLSQHIKRELEVGPTTGPLHLLLPENSYALAWDDATTLITERRGLSSWQIAPVDVATGRVGDGFTVDVGIIDAYDHGRVLADSGGVTCELRIADRTGMRQHRTIDCATRVVPVCLPNSMRRCVTVTFEGDRQVIRTLDADTLESGPIIASLPAPTAELDPEFPALAADGRLLLPRHDGTVVLDTATGAVTPVTDPTSSRWQSAAWGPDGAMYATVVAQSFDEPGQIRRIGPDGTTTDILGAIGEIYGLLSVSPDGKQLASAVLSITFTVSLVDLGL
jgi:hypothetical protein